MQSVCIVIRGELLRDPTSTYAKILTKELKPHSLDPKIFHKQNEIMESILNHIVQPYKKQGYHVDVSGCVYECPNYTTQLNKYFPNNTIVQIQSGHTNSSHMMHNALEHAENQHPYCVEYIILRVDYLMLRDVKLKETTNDFYSGFPWINKTFPQVDVFFIISKKAMKGFKNILHKRIHIQRIDTHYILQELRQLVEDKQKILLYPIWDDYQNAATGLSFPIYKTEMEIHSKRPFVNYIREVNIFK